MRRFDFVSLQSKWMTAYEQVQIRFLPIGRFYAEVELTIYGSQKGYPEHLRLVRFFDEEQGREFMFLTNAMELTALQVADLYKKLCNHLAKLLQEFVPPPNNNKARITSMRTPHLTSQSDHAYFRLTYFIHFTIPYQPSLMVYMNEVTGPKSSSVRYTS